MAAISDTRVLIDSNAREAADLTGELVLLLERAGREPACLADARLVTGRLSDRLGQAKVLERWLAGAGVHADAWAPLELLEELEYEALGLAAGALEVEVGVPELAPPCWCFDRELVSLALRSALHSAMAYAHRCVRLELALAGGYLGFSVGDDHGAFPAAVLQAAATPAAAGECNGNALVIHFARVVAVGHARHGRHGRIELENRADGAGTRFALWLP